MATNTHWPVFQGNENPLQLLVAISRFYGSDPEFVLGGGGNTSVKSGGRLFVKGSGHALATIGPDGFVELDRSALERLVNSRFSDDRQERERQFKDAVMAARICPEKGQRPSVEAVLHHLLPKAYVIHSHATACNMIACCVKGEQIARDVLGNDVLWLPEVDAGLVLALTLRDLLGDYQKRTGRDCPRAVIMQNHGLVVAGDTPDEVKQHTDWLLKKLAAIATSRKDEPPFGAISRMEESKARRLINIIGPALRGLLGEDRLKIVSFCDCEPAVQLAGGSSGRTTALGGPLTPDQIVYCRSLPLWFESAGDETANELVRRLREQIETYRKAERCAPIIVLVKGVGLFAAGDDHAGAQTARAVYVDSIKVMAGAMRLGGVKPMSDSQRHFIETWEAESYRKQVSAGRRIVGRVAGKVALVTGGAQGFGLEIATDLANQGAYVAIADVNAEGSRRAAAEICSRLGAGRAIGLAVNVADSASLEEAMNCLVRTYGGLDVLISNAGVLRAGSVKDQSEKDFDFVTTVNYKGYFLCVQKASPIMAVQRLVRPDLWMDIIQVNSKSGLQGSNRNGAYAGSKFGAIGLTQSFAMELVEDGIKVNAICPGNFFDGPLWSDPDNGLFVQYLRSGKVPGAKTVADVRSAYEAKVLMGRGCTAADIMHAIYYVIDQQYETGQAIAVTGGQVMLS